MIPSRIRDTAALLRPRAGLRARSERPDFAALEANSHRPEVQKVIAEWIRRGVVRVQPLAGSPGKVHVFPATPEPPDD